MTLAIAMKSLIISMITKMKKKIVTLCLMQARQEKGREGGRAYQKVVRGEATSTSTPVSFGALTIHLAALIVLLVIVKTM